MRRPMSEVRCHGAPACAASRSACSTGQSASISGGIGGGRSVRWARGLLWGLLTNVGVCGLGCWPCEGCKPCAPRLGCARPRRTSDFYPELTTYYEERARQWLEEFETEAEIAQRASARKEREEALAERIRAASDSAGVVEELESAVAAGWTRFAAWEIVGTHARALDPELLNAMLLQFTGGQAVWRLMKNPALTEDLGAYLLSWDENRSTG